MKERCKRKGTKWRIKERKSKKRTFSSSSNYPNLLPLIPHDPPLSIYFFEVHVPKASPPLPSPLPSHMLSTGTFTQAHSCHTQVWVGSNGVVSAEHQGCQKYDSEKSRKIDRQIDRSIDRESVYIYICVCAARRKIKVLRGNMQLLICMYGCMYAQ